MKAFVVFFMFIIALPAFATYAEMKHFVDAIDGQMYRGRIPVGYRSVKVNSIPVAGGLKSFFTRTTKEKEASWKNFVLTSGEYSDLSAADRRKVAANPLAELRVKALLEIEEVYGIYKGNKLIGYFVQITDHVQAAIYQDGAWFDVFFDSDLNLVASFDQSA